MHRLWSYGTDKIVRQYVVQICSLYTKIADGKLVIVKREAEESQPNLSYLCQVPRK